jgi:hypothetical protein
MIVRLDENDWWPVYTIAADEGAEFVKEYDIPRGLVERLECVTVEFRAVQRALMKIVDG